MGELAGVAATFWHLAPDYVARETLNQKALTLPKRRFRAGARAMQPPKPEFSHREIVSYYTLFSFRASSDALHGFREIVSVDGQTKSGDSTPDKLRTVVNADDEQAKKALLTAFEKTSLAVAATGETLVDADRAILVDFGQSAGGEALRVAEPGREVREPHVRGGDLPLLRLAGGE